MAALLLLVVTATVLVVGGATAVSARHAAQLAADLAALAGAGRIGVDDAGVCTAADRVATANGARVTRCEVTPTGARTGQVRVEVVRRAWWGGLTLGATGRARAARLDGTGQLAPGRDVHPAGLDPPRCDVVERVAALPPTRSTGRVHAVTPGHRAWRTDCTIDGEALVDLTLNTARVQERAVLEVGGEVDMYSSPTLRERIAELLDSGESVLVVDLSGTSFLDSTGLGALVAGLNHAKQVGGEMPIVCSSDRILKLFRITGLDGVFTIYPSVDEAVGAPSA